MAALVKDKAVKAFSKIKRPIFVDHTGLQFELLGGFPGGLTEIFWNKLQNKRLAEIIGQSSRPGVTATTYLAYCDGKKVHLFKGSIEGSASEVHEAIVKAGFRKIYTTNYDSWLEKACEHWGVRYRKLLTMKDLTAKQSSALEIVKYHGDFFDDATLVLTESSYFERLDFESPLDQMLRADVLRHPVLFVGYSLSDINVRYLLHKLSRIWREAGHRAERPPSHIFMTNPNPVAEAIFQRWGVNPIIEPTGHPKEGLRDFLRKITPVR